MASEIDDAQVIGESLRDPARFELIFQRYYADIYRYTVRRVGDEDGADLAAEVFVEAFASRRRFDLDRDNARPWLYGIAANLVRSHLRSKRRRQRGFMRIVGVRDAAVGGALDAEARVDAAALAPALAEGLSTLNEGDRETLLLYALGELSYGEVAEALGIPVGTVRSRLSRARHVMRELIESQRQTTSGTSAEHDEAEEASDE